MNYYEDLSQNQVFDRQPMMTYQCGGNMPQPQPYEVNQSCMNMTPMMSKTTGCPSNATKNEQKNTACIPLGKNYPLFKVDTAFMLGNLFEGLYEPYRGLTNFPLQPCSNEQALLYQVLAYQFAAHELNLLLDNDPKNEKLIQLFNQYNSMYNRLLEQYSSQYRPLFVNSTVDTNQWTWIHSPWPWENK